MRPLLAAVFTVTLIGGIYGYTRFTAGIRPGGTTTIEKAAGGSYALDITLTFDAAGDAFGNPAVLVKFRDQVLLEEKGSVQAGQPIRIDNVAGIKVGENDFFVQATPAVDTGRGGAFSLEPENQTAATFDVSHAIRVRVIRDDAILTDRTLWSEPGLPVSGLIPISIVSGQTGADDSDRAEKGTE